MRSITAAKGGGRVDPRVPIACGASAPKSRGGQESGVFVADGYIFVTWHSHAVGLSVYQGRMAALGSQMAFSPYDARKHQSPNPHASVSGVSQSAPCADD